ncbi:MAG TPA: Vi polysaccharide biosynthesis UDP-N-acetylglucosamine C-6 dehydrogenase TviB [Pirellulaceae bacterium]|nr:Vi polysaccharide biosynthesis UDP-N-acetylglucosamine C-6 dehydrogenase TviB [Pirellulaceae bacterium]HMP68434.1 Vi polysaccharide biosynthesis UDP-N-acetylglucosamine C-6 dehydrogenase TviB [Pirellulaceae bacterium]
MQTLAIIGLGYVGLPLAVEFGKKYPTLGFDINPARIAELQAGRDSTLEVEPEELAAAKHLTFHHDIEALKQATVYIVTVPTPIDRHKRPDLGPLVKASRMLGKVIKPGDIVIYESTVYPGATEEDCIPLIEQESGLEYNVDFFAGYSPERINPGDKQHRLTTIKKVTSGSTPEVAETVDQLYRSIITAGTHKASSIRVAEAAKVIENTQRDLNIALVNELALIFHRIGIDTLEVLEAAGTKWNFLPFRPGLVGGHCIGVDPYYLTHKAQELGHTPEVILAGRRINDNMGHYVVTEVVKLMLKRRIHVEDANVLILGLTFKENCPDLRNTRVIDIVNEFRDYGANIDVYDPWVSSAEAEHEYGITPVNEPAPGKYDAIILAVAHNQFVELGIESIRRYGRRECVVYDIKSVLGKSCVDGRL